MKERRLSACKWVFRLCHPNLKERELLLGDLMQLPTVQGHQRFDQLLRMSTTTH